MVSFRAKIRLVGGESVISGRFRLGEFCWVLIADDSRSRSRHDQSTLRGAIWANL
jgi:hypothetical protein